MSLIVCRLIGDMGVDSEAWRYASALPKICVAYGLKRAGVRKNMPIEPAFTGPIISDIERGARNPTIMIVEKLAQALDVTAAELVA